MAAGCGSFTLGCRLSNFDGARASSGVGADVSPAARSKPMTTNASISDWPDFDFRSLPLDPISRNQLAGIYGHVRASGSVPPHRSKLLTGFVIPAIFVPERGLYLPASGNIYLLRKLRVYCERFEASFATFPGGPVAVAFFSNALLIPPG